MAKQYKTGDVLKELENDQVTKFKLVDGCKLLNYIGIIASNINGYLRIKNPRREEVFNEIDLNKMRAIFLNGIWEKLQEPVDFMTAVNSGKKIKPDTGVYVFDSAKSWIESISYRSDEGILKLINGKWLIQEDEE